MKNFNKIIKNMLAVLMLTAVTGIYAQDRGQVWADANDAYSLGKYQSALEGYASLEDMGYESYRLYYNMGNAFFKSGEPAKAILYYEKALKLNPAGKDALNNLKIARLRTLDKIESVPEFILTTWVKDLRNLMSSDAWGYTAVGLLAAVALLLLLFRFAPSTGQRKLSFVLACTVMLVSIISVAFSVNLRIKANSQDTGIIMVPVSNVKSAPNATGNNLFILHTGTKIEIIEQAGKWCNIEIADGRQGWIEEKDMEII